MKLLLVAIFIASAECFPRSEPLIVEGSGLERSLVNVPEGCNFISSTKSVDGGVIKGEYVYEDPLGSQITVKYQVNVDGTHYLEKRIIIKGYETEAPANLLTAEQVVKQVTTELKPTVIKIIRATVLQANVDLNNYDNLVETILVQLKPVVTAAVNNALATSPHSHLDANELIRRILVELRPFVEQAIREEVAAQQPKVTEEDIVKLVKDQLKDTIITIVTTAVSSSTDTNLLQHQEKLVSTIMVQLREVVLRAVQRALTASNVHGFNEKSLTDRIIVELTPFVRHAVSQQIQIFEAKRQANAGKIVDSVINDLRPVVIRIIKETVRNYDGDLSKYDNLVQSILVQLRPVILAEVKRALATSSYKGLNAEALAQKIITQLKPFVEEGVQEQIRLLKVELQANSRKIVGSVIKDLRPVVIRIIKEAVQNYQGDLSQYGNLVQSILVQLRPVVLGEVKRALGTSSYRGLNAEDLTQKIMVQIKPFVEEGVQEQIRLLKLELQNSANQVVQTVINDLKPIVIRIIRDTVRSSNADLSQYNNLVQTIIAQLRPVVLNEVKKALSTSTKYTHLNAQDLTKRIIVELTPFVQQGIEEQIRAFELENRKTPDEIVNEVTSQLKPTVIQVIHSFVSKSNVDLNNLEGLVKTIVAQLKPVVLREVTSAINANNVDYNAQSLANKIIIKLTPFVREGVRKEAEIQRANQHGNIVSTIIKELNPHIKSTIKEALNTETVLNQGTQNNAVAGVLTQLRSIIRQSVQTTMGGLQSAGTLKSYDDEAIIVIINGQLNILELLKAEIRKLIGNQKPLPPNEALEKLMTILLPQIRTIILAEITAWRQTANPQLSSTQLSQITSSVLSGLGGQVKLATTQLLKQSSSSIGDDVVANKIIAQFQSAIKGALEGNTMIQQLFTSSGSFASSDAYAILMRRILAALRTIIIEQIRIYRASLVVVTQKPIPTGGSKISNIFGTGGTNTVQVETPNFNYAYNHA